MLYNNRLSALSGSLLILFSVLTVTPALASTTSTKNPTLKSQSSAGQKIKHTREDHIFGTVTAVSNTGFTLSSVDGSAAHPTTNAVKGEKSYQLKNIPNNAKPVTVLTDTKTQTMSVGKKSKSQTSAGTVSVGDRVVVTGTGDKTTGSFAALRVMVLPAPGNTFKGFSANTQDRKDFFAKKIPSNFKLKTIKK